LTYTYPIAPIPYIVVVFYKCRGFENKIEFLPLHIVVKKKGA